MQVEIDGLESINRTLQDLENKLINTRPLINELGNHIYNTIEESFETQTTPDGKSWSPIKKAMHKNYGLGTDKILYRTGHMRNSLYHYSVIGGGMVVGVNATSKGYAYPLVHQFGTDKAGKNKNITIVARPFMPIKANGEIYKETERELEELIDAWFELEGIKR